MTIRVCSKNKQDAKHPRQHAAVVDKARPVSSVLHLHLANLPSRDSAGLRRGLTLAWSYYTGHAFAERVASCGTNHLPCEPASCCTLCVRT